MHRMLSNLAPALILAAAMLLATAVAAAAPRTSWAAVAGPVLLVLGLLGADLVARHRCGGRSLPSASVLLLAAGLLVACGIVASLGVERLAETIPLLGSCAAVPVILRQQSAHIACRRA